MSDERGGTMTSIIVYTLFGSYAILTALAICDSRLAFFDIQSPPLCLLGERVRLGLRSFERALVGLLLVPGCRCFFDSDCECCILYVVL